MSASAEINRPERRRDASIARNSPVGTPFFATARLPQRCRKKPLGRLAVAGPRQNWTLPSPGGGACRAGAGLAGCARGRGGSRGRATGTTAGSAGGAAEAAARPPGRGAASAIRPRQGRRRPSRHPGPRGPEPARSAAGQGGGFSVGAFRVGAFSGGTHSAATELLPEISGAGRRCPTPLWIAAAPARVEAAGGGDGARAWWRIAHVLDSAGRCRNWTRDEPHRRVAGHARPQPDRRTRTPPRRAGSRARDRAPRLRDDPGIEFLRQHGAVYGAGAGDRTHRLRHRDRADLCADGGGIRARRRVYPRGLGRTVSVRHRRRARSELRADGRDPRQAARRYPCLCRQVPLL